MNVFQVKHSQRGNVDGLRVNSSKIRTVEGLNLPSVIRQICEDKRVADGAL